MRIHLNSIRYNDVMRSSSIHLNASNSVISIYVMPYFKAFCTVINETIVLSNINVIVRNGNFAANKRLML